VENDDARRRFNAEKQILANLNHPNIVRLFDAGDTPDGYPYVVMDYVDGIPLNRYCDQHRLSIKDRLTLFLSICSAVEYAHQHLILHRDLKPANILVTADGQPKLLDFGIAKLLTSDSNDYAKTRWNHQMFTPDYASPEQVTASPLTTASDVYALGVILYELLTGIRPYDSSTTSQSELARSICLTAPTQPSQVVDHFLDEESLGPAQARNTTLSLLKKQLAGDLDAITLRALRKEPSERYSSAAQLAEDIQQHIAGRPVTARQGTRIYYIKHFIKQHAFAVFSLAVFVTTLISLTTVLLIRANTLRHERNTANFEQQTSQSVADFMMDVFNTDSMSDDSTPTTARLLLDRAAAKINTDLNRHPRVKARLLESIGRTYSRQRQPQQAIPLLEQAVELNRKLFGNDSPAVATSLISLGRAQLILVEFSTAEKALNEARSILERANQIHTSEYGYALYRLSYLELQKNNFDKAFQLYEQVLTLFKEIYGDSHTEVAMVLSGYGEAKLWASDYASALPPLRQAFNIYKSVPETHIDRLTTERILGVVLLETGYMSEAQELLEHNVKVSQQTFGTDASQTTVALLYLALLQEKKNNLVEAEKLMRQGLTNSLDSYGDRHFLTASTRVPLATILWRQNKLIESEQQVRLALNAYHSNLPADHLHIATAEHLLSEIYISTHKLNAAQQQLLETIERLKRLHAAPWRIARSESALGYVLFKLRQYDQAQPLLERGANILSHSVGVQSNATELSQTRLALFYKATGRRPIPAIIDATLK
jgi:eukaryotic-like serine/threonine-protein kinase